MWVGVNAPLPVLEQREKERGNRIQGSARGQFHKVHVNATYDLEINTHQTSVSENAEKIKSLALCPPDLLEATAKKMKITLSKATQEDKNTIQNLGRFYVYEMTRYCGFLPSWEVPSNGLFECIDLSSYCEKPDRHAFLVKVDDELAGFVLINKVGSTPDVDWNIGGVLHCFQISRERRWMLCGRASLQSVSWRMGDFANTRKYSSNRILE